jgi:hypothetical protein
MLFQDSKNAASFAVASVLTVLALVTLLLKVTLERRTGAKDGVVPRELARETVDGPPVLDASSRDHDPP